jgi:teichoic acid transport system permease protein
MTRGRANLPAVERGAVPSPPAAAGSGEETFSAERHVYAPHRIGLPPLRPYLREVWRRRQFAAELSRTTLRAQHFQTALGQLWLLLNPLLLTLVYFMLVEILRRGARPPHYFAHLMAGLFAYHLFSGAITQASRSVVSGGRLVLNTAFPRTLLPLSAVATGFMRFLPTLGVYAVVHVASGLPVGPHLLWVVPEIAILVLFTAGTAMLVAAAQVYFRDVASFLPYILRIWMYGTPILYFLAAVPDRYRTIIDLNPLTPVFAAWSDTLIQGTAPDLGYLGWALAWAVAACVGGGLFFISREREFAVRL